MKRLLLMMTAGVLSISALIAQMTVSGKVTTADGGTPLEGVEVMVKDMLAGALTDGEGSYRVEVPSGGTTLVFSYTGRKTIEEAINGRATIDVAMAEDFLQTDEVVVTALGISRSSKELGYSAQNINGSALVNSRESNVVAGLSGKVAGVQVINSGGSPGGSAFIRIRGGSSITGNNQPLFVVDGVPIDNGQNASGSPDNGTNNFLQSVNNSNRAIDINPNDIKSMTVLKGAAATALYGIRASNGAIIIETNKGGDTKGKMHVNLNSSYTMDQVNRLPDLQMQYGQGRGGLYYGPDLQGNPRAFRSWGPSVDTLVYQAEPGYLWNHQGRIVGKSTNPTGTPVVPVNNTKDFFQTGSSFNNSISFTGGNQGANFRASLSRLDQKGIVPNSSFVRNNVSVAGQVAINDKMKVSSSVNFVNSGGQRAQQGSNTSGLMLGLLRTPNTFDATNGGSDPTDAIGYEFASGAQRSYAGIFDNPYWTINKNKFRDNVNRVFGNVQFDYNPFEWMSLTYRLGTDVYSDQRRQEFAVNSSTSPAGQLYTQTYLYQHLNSDLFVTFKKKFGENWDGSIMLGQNSYTRRLNMDYTQGDGLAVANFYHMSNAATISSRQNLDKYGTRAGFADARLSYKSWLYLNGTYRQEWSSVLDGRNFGYGSGSVGLVLTEALGMSDNKILSYAKLRGSYAVVGNDQQLTYSTKNYYTLAAYADGWTTGIAYPFDGQVGFTYSDVLGNPNLRPEKTTSTEVGADLRFFMGRLNVDFTYYNNLNKDQIVPVPISASSGFLQQVVNLGAIRNRGIELVVSASPIKTKDFEWETTINYTRNRSMVLSINDNPNDSITLGLGGFEGSDIRAVEGKPYGLFYGERWERDKAGHILIDETGTPIMSATTGPIGDPNPKFLMGWRNTFTYKKVSLSCLFDVKYGGIIWNGTRGALSSYGTAAYTADGRADTGVVFGGNMVLADGTAIEGGRYSTMFDGAVMVQTDVNGLPVYNADGNPVYLDANGIATTTPTANTIHRKWGESWYRTGLGSGFNGPSELYVEDGSYLRLREVNLSYQIVKNASITLTARNLWLLTKYKGVDPETSLVGSRNAQGLDYFNMPNTRSFGAALNLQF